MESNRLNVEAKNNVTEFACKLSETIKEDMDHMDTETIKILYLSLDLVTARLKESLFQRLMQS